MNGWHPKSGVVRKAGFSLLELVAGILAAAILALTAGSMLWYGYRGWKQVGDSIGLQRDMRNSMEVMSRAVRSGTNMTFSTGLVFTVQYSTLPTALVYANATNLFYQPDATVAGSQMTLVDGSLQQFAVSFATNTATVTLVLRGNQEVLSNQVVLTRRN